MDILKPFLKFWNLKNNWKNLKNRIVEPPNKKMVEESCESYYRSDQPIKSKDQDRFNRSPFASRIADTFTQRSDPDSLVIGIYGAWGEGKSSVLFLMERELEGSENVICVRFNPWHFGSEDRLIRGYFSTLSSALGKKLSTKSEDIGNLLSRYGSVLSIASFGVPGAQINAGEAAKEIGQALSTVELDELRIRLEQALNESGKRVVVLIDDIDRLDREEIQSIFKLVKLSANFQHIDYVLAFDDEMVAAALGEKYGTGDERSGRGFLEKIIQVPLHLPPAEESELRKMTFESIDAILATNEITLTDEQTQFFVNLFNFGFMPRLTTPRQALLYINALTFAVPILRGEVNPVDQILIEGVRIFYPKLYFAIRDNPDYFLHGTDRESFLPHVGREDKALRETVESLIVNCLDGIDLKIKNRIQEDFLKELFPKFRSIFESISYGPDHEKQWNKEQNICSELYFFRYFQYGICSGDISDIVIKKYFETVKTDSKKAFQELVQTGNVERLITKFRSDEDEMDIEIGKFFAVSMAENGSLLPRSKIGLFSDWAFMQAGILIAQILKRVAEGEEREDLTRQIIQKAVPLPFAVQCFRWIHLPDEKDESDRIVSKEMERELGDLLAKRIKEAASEAPLYKTYGNDAPALYWIWNEYGEKGEIEKRLRERFERQPEEVDEFLDTYVGMATEMQSGISRKSDFDRSSYDTISRYVDPNIIYLNLKTRYGSEIDNSSYHQPRDIPSAKIYARQFAFIHEKVQEELKLADVTTRE